MSEPMTAAQVDAKLADLDRRELAVFQGRVNLARRSAEAGQWKTEILAELWLHWLASPLGRGVGDDSCEAFKRWVQSFAGKQNAAGTMARELAQLVAARPEAFQPAPPAAAA